MTIGEYTKFISLFGFQFAWVLYFLNTIRFPEKMLQTKWGKSVWKKSTPSQVRLASILFLLIGIGFLGSSLSDLYKGKFKWRGNPRSYSFSDFIGNSSKPK